jgi:putative ABC transport system ATP-binding protein
MPTSSSHSSGALVSLRGVSKTYPTPSGPFAALRDIDLEVQPAEFVAVIGKSGSGKSTLLNLLSGIDRATAGEVIVAATRVHALDEGRLAAWRGRAIGIVFQSFQLLPTLTAAENVMLPMDFLGERPPRERRARALALLADVGIADQADKLPSALSSGQQQRAALARALANDPPLLLADEPTGNLDSATADAVLALFADLVARGKTVVMVTHERDVSRFASRTIALADGVVIASDRSAHREARHA